MSPGYSRSTPFLLTFALLTLAFVCMPDDGHAQPVPVTKIENAAGDSVLTVFDDGGFAAYGEEGTGVIPVEGAGARLMWHPAKAAFRAGEVSGNQWDATNVGANSVAFGTSVVASGDESTAMGRFTTASGSESTAMGTRTTASGQQSTAMGGGGTTASGRRSTAMGAGTTASGSRSVSMGRNTEAGGSESLATGLSTSANGGQTVTMGVNTTAATNESLSIGRYNDANRGNDDSDPETGPLFVVGNGSFGSGNRSDALVLDQSGDLEISGTLTENSDRRLKEQIQPLGTGVLAPLGEIEPVRFQFKNESTHPSGNQLGLIAQQVQAQFPALVSEGSSGHLSVSYSKFTAVLLKGLQEQQAEIERLETKANRIGQLEARLAKLEQQDTSRLAALGGPWSAAALLALGLLGLGLFMQRRQRA
jgi:hypothetical protein